MYESWKHGWKETLSSLTPLIVLGLIFIAAWCTADPLTELFRAQLERIRESNNFDEVTPFYLVSFMVMVLLIPMYVCFFQYVANPTVFYRNRKKFIAISLIISSSMFLALFLNTVGIAVEFGWPVSMKWTFVFWLEVVMVPLLTIGVFI